MSDSRTMSTAAVPETHAQAVGWQVWVPCIGMALCSWLSFVDRQVLNILAPTIIKDTGLTNQDFTAATSFFFLTYTLGNPVWGSVIDYIGLRKGMLLAVAVWTAASMSHSLMASGPRRSGIITAPMVPPLNDKAMPRPRWAGDSVSTAVRRPPGNVPPSPTPSTARASAKPAKVAINECDMLAAVHTATASSIPLRSPM